MTGTFAERYGPWACVAGASMGIGRALSHEAAARGLNVVMVARGEQTLKETAAEVRDRGVEVRTLVADLADPAVGQTIATATDDIEIGLLVYNAAVAPMGRFLDIPLEQHLLSVAVNCATPVLLCHLLAPGMVERGRGGIALV